MRSTIAAAVAAAALFGAGSALAQSPSFTDQELSAYAEALEVILPIAQAAGGAPSAEQQAQMAQAVTDAGLTPERFNAIATAGQSDAVVRARIDLAAAGEPTPGGVSAATSDAEIDQFARAMVAVRAASGGSSAPTPEQQAAMGEAATSTGLTVERFNAIGAAIAAEEHLRARIALAEAELAG